MARENVKRPYPVGSVVLTPTGRRAKVIGYYTDGRVELRYMGAGTGQGCELALKPELVRSANNAGG